MIIALFHGSGINYVSELVENSDADDLIKSIFPVLFILPTLQLLGLAIFGWVATTLKHQANKILIPLSLLVLADALLAFYLNATVPGIILLIPAALFMLSAYTNSKQQPAQE